MKPWAQVAAKTTAPNRLAMKQIAESPTRRKETRCYADALSKKKKNPPVRRSSRTTPTFISLPTRTNSQIGDGERPRGCRDFASLPSSRDKFLEGSNRGGSDGAAVDDPGVRGGGGGGGGCAGHAPGAPRRAGPDRRAHVLALAAARKRDPLRCLPAPGYLLEEGAQADVHIGGLHRRRAHPFREIYLQSPEECHTLCFSMPPLLVHLSHCQVQQGY